MERRGREWPIMRRAMFEFNGTEPEIEHDRDSGFVRVRFLLEGISLEAALQEEHVTPKGVQD